jgi:hypothetical protein
MIFAALLLQPHPSMPPVSEVVSHVHLNRCADAREGINHRPDKRPVAQTRERAGIDCGQQRPRFVAVECGRLALFWEYFGPRTACAGFTPSTLPTTSQSNSVRNTARCCFTEGLDSPSPFGSAQSEHFHIPRDVQRLHAR